MKDTDPHTVKIAFSPMAQHYDGIKFPQVSHQKKQGKIRISEPSNRKIITEEVRKEDYPGKRKRKTNENKTKCTEQQQQQIKWMGTISSKLNETDPKKKQRKQEETEEAYCPTIENSNLGIQWRNQ
jgi:hypothetical protein